MKASYAVCILLVANIFLSSCSLNKQLSAEEKQYIKENITRIKNEIATPIILTAASNCAHYFERNSWPDIKSVPNKNSAFEHYIVKEANSAATFLKFKLKSNPYYWEMDIHIKDNNLVNCKVDTRGGRSPENMNLQVSYSFSVSDSKNTEDIISIYTNENKDFLTKSLLFYCGIDDCFSTETNSDWLNIIGSTITTVTMYALLGLAHGGYNY